MTRAFVFAFVLLFAAACTDPEVALGTVAQAQAESCPKSDCGTNTSVMDGVYFHELHLFGDENSSHVRLAGYQVLPPGAVRLGVLGKRLVAVNAANAVVASANQLVGTKILLDIGSRQYVLHLAAVHREQRYWAADDNTPVETYRFEYIRLFPEPFSVFKPLCKADELSINLLALDALVFEGERYVPETKQITTGPTTVDWFNIACLSGAPAKMHLMRHTTASSDVGTGIVTALRKRLALLNSWTANYCGDGHAFTVPGEPLRLRDANGWLPHSSGKSWEDDDANDDGLADQLSSEEAVWDELGAVCLDTPRREDTEPTIYDTIIEHCARVNHALPPCHTQTWFPASWETHGHIRSANPLGS